MESAPAAVAPYVTPVRVVATIVLALALPLFLVTSGVRWVALGEGFYLDEFARYGVGQVTGLSNQELARVAHEFVTYFQDEPRRLDMIVATPGGAQPLFNEREIKHMIDVQALIQRIFQLWTISLVALVLGSVAMVAVEPSTGWRPLIQAFAIGGGIAVLLIGGLGLAALVGFDRLFYQFHLLSFTNDLWLLDPQRDRLIQLFPLGFFFDAAIRIAVQTVLFGVIIIAGSLTTLRSLH